MKTVSSPGAPQISTLSLNTSVVSGKSARLNCSGEGIPSPMVTWWRIREGGVVSRVVTDGQRFVTSDSLFITPAFLSDEGLYYCNLTSSSGTEISDPIFLDVFSENRSLFEPPYPPPPTPLPTPLLPTPHLAPTSASPTPNPG